MMPIAQRHCGAGRLSIFNVDRGANPVFDRWRTQMPLFEAIIVSLACVGFTVSAVTLVVLAFNESV